ARCVYRPLLADGLPWPAAALWTALIAVGTSCSWSARPNLFTVLFVFLTARACVLFHEGRLSRAATLWLWPLFAVWANVHGGFLAGFTLLGGALLVEAAVALLAFDAEARQEARRRLGHPALLLPRGLPPTLRPPPRPP